MSEKKVGNETFFVEKESSSLVWLAALITEKHTQAVQGLIRATDEKDADKMRGRILLCSELLKTISEA
jgi:hypothetical protein